MPAFEWVHVQLHQQKGMISLSPPTICNSASTELRERIVFEDNYPASKIGTLSDLVQIIDPVNPVNNVARLYTQSNGRHH
jgi:hypothetical protein